MQQIEKNLKIQGAFLRKLEMQIEQILRQMAEEQQSTVPCDNIVNTKEQCKIVTWEEGQSCASLRVEDKFKVDKEAPFKTHPTNDSCLEQASIKSSIQGEWSNRMKENEQDWNTLYKPLSCDQISNPQPLKNPNQKKFLEVSKKILTIIPSMKALEQLCAYTKFRKAKEGIKIWDLGISWSHLNNNIVKLKTINKRFLGGNPSFFSFSFQLFDFLLFSFFSVMCHLEPIIFWQLTWCCMHLFQGLE